MNDILAQVATNTETNRNAGNAILYECVKTVMMIESETGLKILAINILGRFLLNRDNNIRYVALNSLSRVVNDDMSAVQRHRATILECLKDPDVSIRQRALELTYQLVNSSNIQELVREMLNYLIVSAPEHKAALCSRVSAVVKRFAPSPKWQIETLITMLSIAGNHCDDSILCMTVDLVTRLSELHAFATHKLFRLLRGELPRAQIALMHVAVWCIGEYGDHLIVPSHNNGESEHIYQAIPANEVLGLLEAVLRSHLATELTKSYVLTTLMKLCNRLGEGKEESINLIAQYNSSLSLELHQRSCEYKSLLDCKWGDMLPKTFARTPALQPSSSVEKTTDLQAAGQPTITPQQNAPKAPSDLLDLNNLLDGTDGRCAKAPNNLSRTDTDLLSDIFPEASSMITQDNEEAPTRSQRADLQITAYDKDGLSIVMCIAREHADHRIVNVTCKFFNHTQRSLNKFIFQAAVPKYVAMEMMPASASFLPANSLGRVTQKISLKNTSPGKPLKMLIKVQYNVGDNLVIEQVQVPPFPLEHYSS
jgi:AP-1 complex subunit gamma-1